MSVSKAIFLFFLLLLFTVSAKAQTQQQIDSANTKRISITHTGLLVLGTWAAANMAYSGYRLTQTQGTLKYFHQMNVAWNTVNIALAVGGLVNNKFESLPLQKTLAEQHKLEKILLLNIGLDAAYIATGIFLLEKAKNATTKPERWKGFGNSLLLQGGFLLAFDGIFYYALQKHGNKTIQLLSNIQIGFNSIGYTLTF